MSSARWANILVCTVEAALLVQPVWWAPARATRPWTCFVPNIAILACKECTIWKREWLEHTDPSPTRLNVVSELRGAGETVSLTRWGLDVSLPVYSSARPLGLRGPSTFLSEGQCWDQEHMGALQAKSGGEQMIASGCRGQRCQPAHCAVPQSAQLVHKKGLTDGKHALAVMQDFTGTRVFHSRGPCAALLYPRSTAPRTSPGSRTPALTSRRHVWSGRACAHVPEASPQRGHSAALMLACDVASAVWACGAAHSRAVFGAV